MRKYLWIAVIALIASAVYFTSCERIPKMMDTILPDAEQVEPMEPEPTEMMEPQIVEMGESLTIGKIYWTQTDGVIRRANPDGSEVEDLVTGLGYVSGIDVDRIAGKMYWVDHLGEGIQRANLDGTGIETIVPVADVQIPAALELDISAGKMYWTGDAMRSVIRANLDGSNIQDFVTGIMEPTGIDLDLTAGKVYWSGDEKVSRSNFDLSGVEELVTTDNRIFHLALSPTLGKMYWADLTNGSIQRSNLNGTDIETIVTGLGVPGGIELELFGGKVYWRDWNTDKIQRANLDGTNVEDVVTNVHDPDFISFLYSVAAPMMPADTEMPATVETPPEPMVEMEMMEPEPEPKAEYMYWAEWGSGKIRRANLDGSNVQDIVDTGYFPVGITIDLSAGKLYWTDKTSNNHSDPNATNRVVRANLDGSDIEVLFSERNTPDSLFTYFQIVLDPTEGKMYWTRPGPPNFENAAILRADLDGSNVEEIITGLGSPAGINPHGLTLNLSTGKLYWGNCRTGKIQRADLDGSNVEDIITGLSCPQDVEFDVNGEKIYWSEYGTSGIHRADIDGSNAEKLAGGFSNPHTVVFDSFTRKIYWTSHDDGSMYRADYDGSNQEEIISGLDRPVYLALDVPSQ